MDKTDCCLDNQRMALIPEMPDRFYELYDKILLDFASELCDKSKVASFARRISNARGFTFEVQELVNTHYIELLIMFMLGKNENLRFFRKNISEELYDGYFETKEFLTISLNVFRAMDASSKRKFKSQFNGYFNQPQGLIPLAHEMLEAYALTQEGHKVEFVDLAGDGQFDLRAVKNGLTLQIDCKSVGELGLFFNSQAANVVLRSVSKILKVSKRAKACFDKNILHVQVLDRDRSKYDFGREVKLALDAIIEGGLGSQYFKASLHPFTDATLDELKILEHLGMAAYNIEATGTLSAQIEGLAPHHVEGTFVAPTVGLIGYRTAFVFSSPQRPSWKENAVAAIKKSLDGQLHDADGAVLSLRFNNLSRVERERLFFSESEWVKGGQLISVAPSDALFHDIHKSSKGYRERLCALIINAKPTYSRTSILSSSGQTIWQKDRYRKTIYSQLHPKAIRWARMNDHWKWSKPLGDPEDSPA